MKIKANIKTVKLVKSEQINTGEYNVERLECVLSEEYADTINFAVFKYSTLEGEKKVKSRIYEGFADVPSFENADTVKIGVYGFKLENDEVQLRYSPTMVGINLREGTYQEGIDDYTTEQGTDFERYVSEIEELIGNIKEVDSIDIVNNHLIVNYTNGETHDAGVIEGGGGDCKIEILPEEFAPYNGHDITEMLSDSTLPSGMFTMPPGGEFNILSIDYNGNTESHIMTDTSILFFDNLIGRACLIGGENPFYYDGIGGSFVTTWSIEQQFGDIKEVDSIDIVNNHLIVTYTNGEMHDAGVIEGGGGTDDYDELINQPQVNGNTLTGNKTSADLALQDRTIVTGTDNKNYYVQFGMSNGKPVLNLTEVQTNE